MLLQTQCMCITDCLCHALGPYKLPGSWYEAALPGRFLFLTFNTLCAMILYKRRARKGFALSCHFSATQEFWGACPSHEKGPLITHNTTVARDRSGTMVWAGDMLQESRHLSPSALAILHQLIQLQNKTILFTLRAAKNPFFIWITCFRLLSCQLLSIWSNSAISAAF